MAARIQVPEQARSGEVIEIRVLIQHPMETGYRYDGNGQTIARNTIRTLICRYAGAEIFRADLSPGIAANPYLQFTTVARASGDIEFSWGDDEGVAGSERTRLNVAA